MTPRAVHTILTESQLAKLAATDPDAKKTFDQFRDRLATGEDVYVITGRDGKSLSIISKV